MLCESSGRLYQGELGWQSLCVAACAPLSRPKGRFRDLRRRLCGSPTW
jgi:hypothetical protein